MISAELDRVQARLHDSGTLWPRAELLRYLNDGYKNLVSRAKCTKRFFIHDVPGRVTYAGSFEWEDRHANGGLFRRFTRPGVKEGYLGTFTWESEHLDGVTPEDGHVCTTYMWETAFTGEVEQHFKFVMAASHERTFRVAYNGRPLAGTTARVMDVQRRRWWTAEGLPVYWLNGVGRDGTIELFEIDADYRQAYDPITYEQGMPRELAGDRAYDVSTPQHAYHYGYTTLGDADGMVTHTLLPGETGVRFTQKPTLPGDANGVFVWERQVIDGATSFTDSNPKGTYWWENEYLVGTTAVDGIDPGLGSLRGVTSPDRQYLPVTYDAGQQQVGIGRDFKSSDDSVTVLEAIVPIRELTETDELGLLPAQMAKYLRYYTLSRAYGRSGEGQRVDLSDHYAQRFERGVVFMRKLVNIVYRDRVYGRESLVESRAARPPRVHLPSEFERLAF